MKYTLLQIGVLAAVVAAVVGLGRGLAAHFLGPAGVTALYAAAVICFGVSVVAAIPIGLTARYRPLYVAQVAFAGTGVRLLGTAAVGLGYQLTVKPDLLAFSSCLVAVYLPLLVAETVLVVYIVSRALPREAPQNGVNGPC